MAYLRLSITINPSFLFLALPALLSLARISSVLATQYTPGDSAGWNLGTNYATWASQYTFVTGDTLQFNYGGLHSVLQVSEADYKACNTANAISSDSSGSTLVTLGKAQTYYFICGTSGHCQGGMQLSVVVGSGAATNSTTPTTGTPSSSTPQTPSSPSTPSTPSNNPYSASSPSPLANLSFMLTLLLAGGAAAMVTSHTSLSM